MCQIFVNTDPILYEARSRSVRIHGMVTSIRLENLFWNVLAGIAAEQGTTTNRLIVTLYDEVVEVHGSVQNLASFLRVSCVRYLTLTPDAAADDVAGGMKSVAAASGRDGASVVALRPDRARSR
ncbi:Predicted DNA-binding protein, contains Ribbon-helix-helix (RHH) domain [Azospirillum oryzae]|uniref:Predicted DNA-binding protein, contains Ribbon-helix-helix (RHH) domain n=1 Tax=Azospirillum oryzae TaxID=286727 RepID=A0A1X7FK59_9PROT|nr:ribbon-helix-helix domain-containing protein [Azospirillum oryzae]SMF53654.1 Predicted DNA-binding protein, contains Ribbon-helix-helix (RHH) domain [Azospirillum oryzae]